MVQCGLHLLHPGHRRSTYCVHNLFAEVAIVAVQKITSPDLIILDIIFGDQTSGWQMLQMLKMQRSTASIPVIVCTAALNMVREQEGYLVSQGVHVIFKPFDIDHLLANIKHSLETHKHLSTLSDEEEKKKR